MSRPRRSGGIVAALAVVLTGCASASSSGPGPPAPGDRVRLIAPSVVEGEVMGEVQEISREELLLRVRSEEELLVPVDALRSLAIQQGTRRRVKEGALIGLGTGAAAVGAIVAAEGGCGGDSMCESVIGWVAGIFVGGGALVGTLVGLLFETEVWHEETLPLAIRSTPSGLRVEFRLAVGRDD